MQDAVKIYRMMRYLDSIEYVDSIKAMYSDMNKSGFHFYLLDHKPKEIDEDDRSYKIVEVSYTLYIVKYAKNNEQAERKQLKKWWTIYCMTKKDITYNEFREENVWESNSSCDVCGILDACGIKINSLNYFQRMCF